MNLKLITDITFTIDLIKPVAINPNEIGLTILPSELKNWSQNHH